MMPHQGPSEYKAAMYKTPLLFACRLHHIAFNKVGQPDWQPGQNGAKHTQPEDYGITLWFAGAESLAGEPMQMETTFDVMSQIKRVHDHRHTGLDPRKGLLRLSECGPLHALMERYLFCVADRV